MEQSPAAETAATVRAELARRNIKPKELVATLGWKKSTVHRRLTGKYPFTITELASLADYLDIPLTTLLPAGERVA